MQYSTALYLKLIIRLYILKKTIKRFFYQKMASHLLDIKTQATIRRIEEANRIMDFGDENPLIVATSA